MMNCRACRRASSRSSWTPAARARSNASGEVLKRVNELVYSGVKAPVVGVCRLATKTGATQLPRELGAGHTRRVKAKGVPVVVYEPTLDAPDFNGRRGHARPRGVQGRVRRDHRQPLERGAGGRRRQGVHEGFV